MCLSDDLLCTFRSSSCCIPGNRKRDASTSFSPGDSTCAHVSFVAAVREHHDPNHHLDSTHLRENLMCSVYTSNQVSPFLHPRRRSSSSPLGSAPLRSKIIARRHPQSAAYQLDAPLFSWVFADLVPI
jgi:hypothetical protein